jgi:hypothetical protein
MNDPELQMPPYPLGTSEYRGVLLSVQNRSVNGLALTANWTLSECISDVVNYEPFVAGIELTKPATSPSIAAAAASPTSAMSSTFQPSIRFQAPRTACSAS